MNEMLPFSVCIFLYSSFERRRSEFVVFNYMQPRLLFSFFSGWMSITERLRHWFHLILCFVMHNILWHPLYYTHRIINEESLITQGFDYPILRSFPTPFFFSFEKVAGKKKYIYACIIRHILKSWEQLMILYKENPL